MSSSIWYFRWHIARVMIHTAIRIAPAGPAKTALEEYLNAYGIMVLRTIAASSIRNRSNT